MNSATRMSVQENPESIITKLPFGSEEKVRFLAMLKNGTARMVVAQAIVICTERARKKVSELLKYSSGAGEQAELDLIDGELIKTCNQAWNVCHSSTASVTLSEAAAKCSTLTDIIEAISDRLRRHTTWGNLRHHLMAGAIGILMGGTLNSCTPIVDNVLHRTSAPKTATISQEVASETKSVCIQKPGTGHLLLPTAPGDLGALPDRG